MLNKNIYKKALFIRRVEETFLELFSKGKINGTVHTCIGQEISAICALKYIDFENDFVISNHRCHGHFLAYCDNAKGLIAELMGKITGVCAGIGSSQHLQYKNFFSNGIQGGILPLSAGISLSEKLNKSKKVVVVFIGDGTLGEGAVYESLNIISRWKLPILIVLENNFYAQSTNQEDTLAGSIKERFGAFGIKTIESSIWDEDNLIINSKKSIEFVKNNLLPCAHIIDSYRLSPHSKGDDLRDNKEILSFTKKDPLERFKLSNFNLYENYLKEINDEINLIIEEVNAEGSLNYNQYVGKYDGNNSHSFVEGKELQKIYGKLINEYFINKLKDDNKTLFIGEDVLSPYGGAFKIADKLSELYPEQVFTTPISELSITGIGNGLSINGYKPYIEIMFGDFLGLTFDQILNHASKFFHMYNKKITCPIVIRTPMGGGRGYGPTHSQSIEKFFLGIDNFKVIALNLFINPLVIYENIHSIDSPVLVIENKLDYTRVLDYNFLNFYNFEISNSKFPITKLTPKFLSPKVTLVSYGGNSKLITEAMEKLLIEHEISIELFFLSSISPLIGADINEILISTEKTGKLITLEEGSTNAGFGSEVISIIAQKSKNQIKYFKLGAEPVPIPSQIQLEKKALPNLDSLIDSILKI